MFKPKKRDQLPYRRSLSATAIQDHRREVTAPTKEPEPLEPVVASASPTKDHKKRIVMSLPGLERYKLIKKLGDGAFANVYMARDLQSGQKVAIKVAFKQELDAAEHGNHRHLHPNMKQRPKATERVRILKEVQIMRGVRHPNIVRLHQFIETKSNYFLIMDLCRGGEIFHRLVDLTYFSEALARHVIIQVANAVRHLHEQCGIAHRDIKLENILFDPIAIIPSGAQQNVVKGRVDGEMKRDEGLFTENIGGGGIGKVKLADFGLSKVIWDNSTLTPCGTVGYTAPEIVRDQKYSKSVDMWSIGCVLYTLLCGFPPFYDESIRVLTQKIAHGQFTFLSPWWDAVSAEAKDLITHLLHVDPRERYTIDDFFKHPWIHDTYQRMYKTNSMSTRAPKKPPTTRTLAIENASRKAKAAKPSIEHHASNDPPFHSPEHNKHGDKQDKNDPVTRAYPRPVQENELYSPGVASLKEILDITYAMQRLGEEKAWQKQQEAQGKTQPPAQAATTMRELQSPQGPDFQLNLNQASLLRNRRIERLNQKDPGGAEESSLHKAACAGRQHQ
ncbi:kinase-like domain-containing protein [Radiomyces spectabilis]|uniref:kinase-like domain-containing protein n=1 Tax=Radiomyces spectabilis TaxID=64574 RepID=UPI00221F6CD5|nr:kinase-like domain-containing protein [Radiomyces spectabilis]KAI8365234.1 kinase-like domain-containing protein [Radiomyces spectabilis]